MLITNATTTKKFLALTDSATKTAILSNVAEHYGITQSEAFEEVTDDEAEHLLDYLTGDTRKAISLLMKRHAL